MKSPYSNSKEIKELEKCTFKPNISASKLTELSSGKSKGFEIYQTSSRMNPVSPYERLYNEGLQQKNKNHHYTQLKWERESSECTFQPEVSHTTPSHMNKNQIQKRKSSVKGIFK